MGQHAGFCIFSLLSLLHQITADSVVVCQGQHLSLACPDNKVLVFKKAHYGRLQEDVCWQQWGDSSVTDCGLGVTQTLGLLSKECFGKTQCFLSSFLQEALFGDPCSGVPKYLDVEYVCSPVSDIKHICQFHGQALNASGFIASTNYPQNYENGEACGTEIYGKMGQILKISLLDMELEYSYLDGQCYDFVVFIQDNDAKVYCPTGNGIDSSESELKYPLAVTDHIRVSFESSVSTDFRGFLLEYNVVGCADEDIPPPPTYGYRSYYDLSESVTYKCYHGYKFENPDDGVVRCVNNRWSGHPGNCIVDNEVVPSSSTSTSSTSASSSRPATSTSVPSTTLPETSKRPTNGTITTTTPTISTPTATTKPLVTLDQSTQSSTTRKLPENNQTSTGYLTSTKASPHDGTSTKTSEEISVTTPLVITSLQQKWKDTAIGLAAGFMALIVIIAVLVMGVIYYRRKNRELKEGNLEGPASSLRPSAHACVSIPNTYAGKGFGYRTNPATAKTLAVQPLSVSEGASLASSTDSDSFVGNNKMNSLSFDSAIYAMPQQASEDLCHFTPDDGNIILYENDHCYENVGFDYAHEVYPAIVLDGSNEYAFEFGRTSLEPILEEQEEDESVTSSSSTEPEMTTLPLTEGNCGPGSRPSSLEDTENRRSKRKAPPVDYPLFKEDDTGNLDNYLESRRVSV